MKDIDQSIQELVATAKISALYAIKNKIQEEINELERKRVDTDEIQF